jgi:small-conductance mechanosensitive channel
VISDTNACPGRRPGTLFAIALSFWLASLVVPLARGADTSPASAPAPAPAAAPAPAPQSLTDTVTLIGAAEETQRSVSAGLEQAQQWRDLDRGTGALASRFEEVAAAVARVAAAHATPTQLTEIDFRLRDLQSAAAGVVARLAAIVRRLEGDERTLESHVRAWQERLARAQERQVPEPILERARSIEAALRASRAKVLEMRDQVLLALDRAVRLQGRIDGARAAVRGDQARARADRMRLEESPLWRLGDGATEFEPLGAELRSAERLLRDYFARHGARLAALFLGVLLAAYWLLSRGGVRAGAFASSARDRPVSASLLIAVTLLWWLAPEPPVYFYAALLMLLPIPAAFVAQRWLAAPAPLSLWGIALAATLFPLRNALDASILVERAIISLQALLIGVPLAIDLRAGRLFAALPRVSPHIVRTVALLLIVVSALTVVSALFGFTGPARWLRSAMGGVLGSALVFGATAVALYGVVLALFSTPLGRWFNSARNADPNLLKAVRFVLGALTLAGIVLVVLGALNLGPTIVAGSQSLMDATLDVGAATISVGGIVAAIAVLVATFVVAAVTRFVLDREVLPRSRMRPGAGYALSTFIRWAIVLCGVVLALAALGLDTSKITLLASALGVGIGFGLQHVVNNFVSGLILIVERNVHVGDLIEVGPLLGEVKHIGIRSSIVRTIHGAEVIVPNGDLASKDVVNWTRSDRQRRYDIEVGVAYGSEPEVVLRLLEEAAKEVPDVLTSPAPIAMFVGFGDSSLDFKLLAWVRSVDVGVPAQNALRVAILHRLDAAGIAIPFPQRDVHLHGADGAAAPRATPSAG